MKDLRRRILALESVMTIGGVTLHFKDGTTRTIRGDFDHFMELFEAATADRNEHQPNALDGEIHAIRSATHIQEQGHMLELLLAILNSPTESGGCNA